ncbi:hypothetical protein F8M41_006576 [Gigaspora margarita]|uniref:Uncharacterized protein n=1 Tax=Gigaspora margarita TaxID=4874 RepID=A0A8H3X7L6_GIGMA|nr:hypothetical protein F8M41_006576 [Gigaspora margarita]
MKIRAKNYMTRKPTKDLSFPAISGHEKRQKSAFSKVPKKAPKVPEYIHPNHEPIHPNYEPTHPKDEPINPKYDPIYPSYEPQSNYDLTDQSKYAVETSTEKVALSLTNQMGGKAEDVVKNEVVTWAKKHGYNDEEAEQLGENAKKLAKCSKNVAISLKKWEFGMVKNSSCISCEQIKSLSNINMNSTIINGTEAEAKAKATLNLLHSLKITIDDFRKCKYNLACMNIDQDTSCLQWLNPESRLSSGSNSDYIINSFMTMGIILIIIIMIM